MAEKLFGRSAEQLLLIDDHGSTWFLLIFYFLYVAGGIPLFLEMADPNSDYFAALSCFKTRHLYGNILNDFQVHHSTRD